MSLTQENLQSIYGVDAERAKIMDDRQRIYGDPYTNHLGIAQMIAPLLQPWAKRIALMEPLPAFVVASILGQLKVCRRRFKYHPDNYDDQTNYDAFARAFQEKYHKQGDPYTAPEVLLSQPVSHADLVLTWQWYDEEGNLCISNAVPPMFGQAETGSQLELFPVE